MAFAGCGAGKTLETETIAQAIDERGEFSTPVSSPRLEASCRSASGSTWGAASATASMPKPGSMRSSRSAKRRRATHSSRVGRLVPTASFATRSIDAIAEKLESTNAAPGLRQIAAEPDQQPLEHGREIVGIEDRLGQNLAHDYASGAGSARRDRLLHAAQRLIQALAGQKAEATGQGCARQRIEIGDAAQAQTLQIAGNGRRQAQGRDGKLGQRSARFARLPGCNRIASEAAAAQAAPGVSAIAALAR